jgi:hypothetical protein
MKKRAKKKKMLTSWTQLAAAMGRGKTSILRASRRPDWPYKLPVPAAEVENVKDWCRINIVPSGAETPIGNPKRDLELRLLTAKIEKMESEVKLLRREWIPRDQVEQENVRKVLAVRNELMNTPRLMAMLAPCTDDAQREQKVIEWARGICNRFAGQAA